MQAIRSFALIILIASIAIVPSVDAQTVTPVRSANCYTATSTLLYGLQRVAWPSPPFSISSAGLDTMYQQGYNDWYITALSGIFDVVYGNTGTGGNPFVSFDSSGANGMISGYLPSAYEVWTASDTPFTLEICSEALPTSTPTVPPTPTTTPIPVTMPGGAVCTDYDVPRSGLSIPMSRMDMIGMLSSSVYFYDNGTDAANDARHYLTTSMSLWENKLRVVLPYSTFMRGEPNATFTFYGIEGDFPSMRICRSAATPTPGIVPPTPTPALPYGCVIETLSTSITTIPNNTATTITLALYMAGPIRMESVDGATMLGYMPAYGYGSLGYVIDPGVSIRLVEAAPIVGSKFVRCRQIAATPTPISLPTATVTATPTTTNTPTDGPSPTATATVPPLPCAVADRVPVPVSPGTTALSLQTGMRFVVAGASVFLNIGTQAREIQTGNYQWDLGAGTYTAYSITIPATVWICSGTAYTPTAINAPTWTPGPAGLAPAACVPISNTATIISFAMPQLGIIIPIRSSPTATITGTAPISMTALIAFQLTVIAGISTPAAGVATVSAKYSWMAGQDAGATSVAHAGPALSWMSILNPQNSAWTTTGGPLWAIEPAILPILPIIAMMILASVGRFLLWVLDWFLKLIDLVIKLIELIPFM